MVYIYIFLYLLANLGNNGKRVVLRIVCYVAKVVDFQCFLQKTGGCSGFYVGLLPT